MPDVSDHLLDELDNFEEIAACLRPSPGDVPRLDGMEIAGFSAPLRRGVGGDHVVYIDFRARYDLPGRIVEAETAGRVEVAEKLRGLESRAGILLIDVAGHRMTDALIAAMVHQSFLLGALYELDRFGEITTRLFEHINTRFYRSTAFNKFFTMIYGEISRGGTFRFLSSAHPRPAVFSREFGRFVRISEERLVTLPPVGLLPSVGDPDERRHPGFARYKKRYEVNEIDLLNLGDLLLLFTDGFSEHADGTFYPDTVERLIREMPGASAEAICAAVRREMPRAAPLADDVSLVVLRRTA